MREITPDLLSIVFDGVDKLQHLCWRLLDPALYPKAPTEWEAHIHNLCLSYFKQLDGIICRIVTLAGPEARTFVASDHGFGSTETVFFTNAWLAKKGYLRWAKNSAPVAPTRIASEPIKNHVEGVDWSHTIAYALTPSSNGIYIRQSAGPGLPGIDPPNYTAFRARLAEELLSITDPTTGNPFFRHVLIRDEAYPGENAGPAPDLTLIMQDYGFQSILNSDTVFRARLEPWGTHYPNGIFIASGPGIARLGRMPPMQIVDVAPVLLRSLDVEFEPEMDGHCPARLFLTKEQIEFEQEVLRMLVQLDYFQER
jgi:predicted AlkP superfamily phosphohydrolase/phosphomutase